MKRSAPDARAPVPAGPAPQPRQRPDPGESEGTTDGVLLRLPLGEGDWAESIPPVPLGSIVTVSFSTAAAADEHGDALRLLGYTVTGVCEQRLPGIRAAAAGATGDAPTDVAEPTAYLWIGEAALLRHARYWRCLAERCSHAFSLANGPAAAAMAPTLALHRPLRP